MSVLTELMAIAEPVTIGGVEYTRHKLTADDFALIDNEILKARGDPIEIARRLAEGQPVEVKKEILGRGYDDAQKAQQVSAGELDTYLGSLEGHHFQFYLSLRRAHPDMTRERARELQKELCGEFLTLALAALANKFPEATTDELVAAAAAESEDGMGKLILSTRGLPGGNSETPEKPGTPTNPCPGENGATLCDNSSDGHMSKSAE